MKKIVSIQIILFSILLLPLLINAECPVNLPKGVDYGFNGWEFDRESCLYYTGTRYYDPKVGAFIGSDGYYIDIEIEDPNYRRKLLNPQLNNSYTGMLNNPVKYIDPDGRSAEDPNEFNKFKPPLGPPIKESRNYVIPIRNSIKRLFSSIKNFFTKSSLKFKPPTNLVQNLV